MKTENETLSEKRIKEGFDEKMFWYHYREEDVQEAVKDALNDVDKGIRKGAERYGICESCADRFDDIIKRRFGEGLGK